MAASSKKGRPSKAQTEKKKRATALAAKRKRRRDLWALGLLAFGALAAALCFIEGEGVWLACRTALFGAFGAPAYALGFLLAAFGVALALDKAPGPGRAFCWVLLAFAASGAFYLFGPLRASESFSDDIKALYDLGSGGAGAMGAFLGRSLEAGCGLTAARVLIILLLLILLLIITGRTIGDLVEGAKKPIDLIKAKREEREFERESALAEAEGSSSSPPWERPAKAKRGLWGRRIDIPIDGEAKPEAASAASAAQTAPSPEFEESEGPEILAVSKGKTVPTDETGAEKSRVPLSRIDIPLGPEFDPETGDPLEDEPIITRPERPSGPAADIVGDILGREALVSDLFTDFKESQTEDILPKNPAF
ncbi:MAG: hypothetical protein Q4B42_03455, partial [Oscillospiraceae bacterium]|nr:hypothetical protein [Oscillospiraceae bacterium]